ncbi:MAG: 2-succinyl-5-enolpyruvyl-6-hydroxy-3-cyclohexene-1-carboxylic-acid synthase [Kofleriaceae bacterium]
MNAAVQTAWTELIAATLADAGVATCVISPGSRSTPLVAALSKQTRLELVSIIDERAAAFFALGVARATGTPAALVCTSGTAAAHYLPALVEASMAGVPMIAITADRPPELHDCGASQTIDQIDLYGKFVRGAFDLGAPVGTTVAARAVRRKLIQAITLARGPHPGPVHLEVPLSKPLEPAPPSTEDERAFARTTAELIGQPIVAPPRLAPDPQGLDALALAIAAEPAGLIVVGAMPPGFAAVRDRVFALARRAGYPVLAEAGSQLRYGARPSDVTLVDQFDLIPASAVPQPRLVIQLGAEPVAGSWSALLGSANPARWVLADHRWHDPDSNARGVIVGDIAAALDRVIARLVDRAAQPAWLDDWHAAGAHASTALDQALAIHPRSETAVIRAALDAVPEAATLQIGNSLPIRIVDHVAGGGRARTVITQRGAAGIDGLIASAAGATRRGAPVLLVLGDVSFAHDIGGLLAARCASAPLAIVVIDNRGGQIFASLPIARAGLGAAYDQLFVTAPELDPAAVASVLGARALTATTATAVGTAVADALATPGVTVIHAPVTTSGARDVRRTAIELYRSPELRTAHGGTT